MRGRLQPERKPDQSRGAIPKRALYVIPTDIHVELQEVFCCCKRTATNVTTERILENISDTFNANINGTQVVRSSQNYNKTVMIMIRHGPESFLSS